MAKAWSASGVGPSVTRVTTISNASARSAWKGDGGDAMEYGHRNKSSRGGDNQVDVLACDVPDGASVQRAKNQTPHRRRQQLGSHELRSASSRHPFRSLGRYRVVRFFATAAKGTEPALRDELRELRLPRVRADRGGVHFEGDLVDGARACLWSRVAMRILLEIAGFEARNAGELYAGTRAIDWSTWMTPRTTLAVRASCRSSQLTHSQFIAQKTKDAVVDAVRDRFGARPSVDKNDPDVLLAVHVARNQAKVYLDVGGDSLHARGWRANAGEAPLRETLAAAVVHLSGWQRDRPLVDPMCGAGTIAIEAAAWSRKMAPGLARSRFGFERWASHDETMRGRLLALREEARSAAVRQGVPPIIARDIDPRAVAMARENARAAGVDVVVERGAVRDLRPLDPPGFVVTNPPYGERLATDGALYEDLARALRSMHGHTAALLAGNQSVARSMGREPDRWLILYNGPIECRLLVYAIC